MMMGCGRFREESSLSGLRAVPPQRASPMVWPSSCHLISSCCVVSASQATHATHPRHCQGSSTAGPELSSNRSIVGGCPAAKRQKARGRNFPGAIYANGKSRCSSAKHRKHRKQGQAIRLSALLQHHPGPRAPPPTFLRSLSLSSRCSFSFRTFQSAQKPSMTIIRSRSTLEECLGELDISEVEGRIWLLRITMLKGLVKVRPLCPLLCSPPAGAQLPAYVGRLRCR